MSTLGSLILNLYVLDTHIIAICEGFTQIGLH